MPKKNHGYTEAERAALEFSRLTRKDERNYDYRSEKHYSEHRRNDPMRGLNRYDKQSATSNEEDDVDEFGRIRIKTSKKTDGERYDRIKLETRYNHRGRSRSRSRDRNRSRSDSREYLKNNEEKKEPKWSHDLYDDKREER
jgi:hypothetical protein